MVTYIASSTCFVVRVDPGRHERSKSFEIMNLTNIIVPLSMLVALLASACSRETGALDGPGGGRPAAVVSVAPIEQGAFDTELRFVGRLRGESAAELFARTDGPIISVSANTGDFVRQGQTIARIDSSDAEQRIQQARAALRMAEATLQQRLAGLQVARTTAERTDRLFSEQLVSQSDYDVTQAELTTAASQVDLARAQIEQAKANMGAAMLELEKTRIVAPFDGWVGRRHLDLGAHAATSRPVFSLVDLATIRMTIAIPAADARRIRAGQQAVVVADALPGQSFRGSVSRISSIFDPQTNTVEAEVEIANPDALLKPGMYATASIAYSTEEEALLVPGRAIARSETEQWLFIAREGPEGQLVARRVPVRASTSSSGDNGVVAVEALEGRLEPGMMVITLGHDALRDGAPVTIPTTDADRTRQ